MLTFKKIFDIIGGFTEDKMSYNEIINLILLIISTLIGILTIHSTFFLIVGLFAKKTYPSAKKKLKYGIIIPARNEGKVVGNLIKSIQKNDYPQDKLQIFVIAHNCTDQTANIARELGATVYELNDATKNKKGYALQYTFEQIEKDFGTQSFDGYFVFDSDNILTENYITKMNDAFVYYNQKQVVVSCRNSKNFGSNVISSLYGLWFMKSCRLECRGRTVCGCSTRVQGTGFMFSSKTIENGWNYLTISEDTEFTADQVLNGNNIAYCDEAMFYDEQPTSIKIMFRQRLRWCRGHLIVFVKKSKALFANLFKSRKKVKNKFSNYDTFVLVLPILVFSFFIALLQIILLAFTPLATPNYAEIWHSYLISLLIGIGTGYLISALSAALAFIVEHKRIKGVSPFTKILTVILWPIFDFLSIPLSIIAIFKNVEWKAIPHTDTTNFEKLDAMQNQTSQTKLKDFCDEDENKVTENN